MVSPPPLGLKRMCPMCNTRFYDLNRRPATCPKCEHSYDPTVQPRPRRARRSLSAGTAKQDPLLQLVVAAKPKPKPKPVKPAKEKEARAGEDFEAGEAAEEELEALEDIEDIETLEVIEKIEEPGDEDMDDDLALEEKDVKGKKLVDEVDEGAEAEEDEESEEDETAKGKQKGKPKTKAKPQPQSKGQPKSKAKKGRR